MTGFKLVIFDMDGTLLTERTIFVFAEKKEFKEELLKLINSDMRSYEKTLEIAKFLKGMNSKELLEIFRKIPLQEHVEAVINEIKRKGIKTAIITSSYRFVAEDLGKRLGIDYVFANDLIINNGIVTGRIKLNNINLVQQFDNCKIHSICKSRLLERLWKELDIKTKETIAVGDSEIDICMLEKAGIGIAFNASDEVKKFADISTNDISIILNYI